MAKRHQKYREASKPGGEQGFKPGDLVIGYFRDSAGSEQDRSVDEQRAEWRRACSERSLTAFNDFEDRARTGTKARGRGGFRAMIDYFESGQAKRDGVRGLLLWSFSRFAREQDDFQFYISLIRRIGFIVQSLTDQIPEGDFGRFFEALVSWKDAQFSRDLSKHVKRGHRLLLNNYRDDGELYQLPTGERVQLVAGGRPPVGYERCLVATGKKRDGQPRYNAYWRKASDPDLAGRVRLAWELMMLGKSYAEIERACGLGIGKNSYNDLFSTQTYTGLYRYGDFERPGAFGPYVTTEEFNRVQELIEGRMKRVKRPDLHRYLLSGLLSCGDCGRPWNGLKSTRAGRNDIYYYECSSRAKLNKPCLMGRLRAESLEKIIASGLIEALEPLKIYNLASQLALFNQEEKARNSRPIEQLEKVIASETEAISALVLQLTTNGVRLGIEADIERLILQARLRRDRAINELDKLRVSRNGFDPASFELNLARLNKSKSLIKGFIALGKPSSWLVGNGEPEIVESLRELLHLFSISAMLYPADVVKASGRASVAISLDLGYLALVPSSDELMSYGWEGGPRGIPCLPTTFVRTL